MKRSRIMTIGLAVAVALLCEPAMTHLFARDRGGRSSRGASSRSSKSFNSGSSSRSFGGSSSSWGGGTRSIGKHSGGGGSSRGSGGGSSRSFSGSKSFSGSGSSSGSFSGSRSFNRGGSFNSGGSSSSGSSRGWSGSSKQFSGGSSSSGSQSFRSYSPSGSDSGRTRSFNNSGGPSISEKSFSPRSNSSGVVGDGQMKYRSGNYFKDRAVQPAGSTDGNSGPSFGNPSSNPAWAYKDKNKGGGDSGERRRSGGDSKGEGPSFKKNFDSKQFGGDKKFDDKKFDGKKFDGDSKKFRSRDGDGDRKKFDGSPKFDGKEKQPFDSEKFRGDKFKGDGKSGWDGKFKGDKDGDFSRRRSGSKHWDKWHDHDDDHDWVRGRWSGRWDNDHHHHYNDWNDNWWWRRSLFWGVSGWWYGPGIYSWGYSPYYNPYCSTAIVIGGSPYNYNQPFITADYTESLETQAARDFASARDAFYNLNYGAALASVDSALTKTSQDAAMHEFRALVLFARGEYEPAAATVHSILSVGPGWDWATMRQFYPSVAVYTEQLRALEGFRRTNPQVAHGRFLLAYHYLTCGYNDAAATELRKVVEIEPRDRIANQILGMITHEPGEQPTPSEQDVAPTPPEATIIPQKTPTPPPPSEDLTTTTPVDGKALVGKWNAKQPDGSTVELSLGPDSKFTWKYTREGNTNEYAGTYTFANNLLILQQSEQEAMVGRVEMSPEKGFRFVLLGGPQDDPGLTFAP